jgi:deoxycytidine triphosphate deaminase
LISSLKLNDRLAGKLTFLAFRLTDWLRKTICGGSLMQVDLSKFQDEVRTLLATPDLPSADDRYAALALYDPYPKIPPALLNAGHLATYAVMTGMIDPFDLDALSKPATYLVPLEGQVRYQDEMGARHAFYLSEKDAVPGESEIRRDFELRPNSICYVTLQPRFRMPAYLAGRFNLLIRDVYRGLLVGTGPLVDPGFVGALSIPVHNFTSNKYILRAGEGFVYFEFTKLSWVNPSDQAPPRWIQAPVDSQPPFPASKNARKTLDNYIVLATGGGPAQNAIQADIKRLEKAATKINLISIGAIIGAFLFVATLIATFLGAGQIYLGAQQYTQAAQHDLLDAHEKLNAEIKALRAEQERHGSEVDVIRREQGKFKTDLSTVHAETDGIKKTVEGLVIRP